MSTEYRFVNNQRKDEAGKLSKILAGIKEHYVSGLGKAKEALPLMEGAIEDIEFALRGAILNCSPEYVADEDVIGRSSGRDFHWRADNGFRGMEDVRQLQKDHPDYHVEDEYGTEIALKDLRAIVKK